MAWNPVLFFPRLFLDTIFFSDETFFRRQRWLGILFSFFLASPWAPFFFSDITFFRRQRWLGILFSFFSRLFLDTSDDFHRYLPHAYQEYKKVLYTLVMGELSIIKYAETAVCVLIMSILHSRTLIAESKSINYLNRNTLLRKYTNNKSFRNGSCRSFLFASCVVFSQLTF